jgi:iduronate 2-sulfatase
MLNRPHFFPLSVIYIFIGLLFSCSAGEKKALKENTLPNILFIPVDDLRPELGAYGDRFIKTPNMDRIASQGVTFYRAYCQQAVCNPSRASLLTGLRPDSLQVWDLQTSFRNNVPSVVTLPQFFKQHGYTTIGLGKTFHNNDPDTISWSVIPEHIEGFPFDPDAVYADAENLDIQQLTIQSLKAEGKSRIDQLGHWYVKANATEQADVDDDTYYDGAQTTRAIEILQKLKSENRPFFLSVGYYRPHLPFNAPKKYWDLYDRSEIPLAENQFIPEGSPAHLVHGEAELRGYSDCHDLPLPGEASWDEGRQREIKHGYFASVSYTDAQIGRLLNELETLGLTENTIIVLWGDHGWKLGEHNGWCKQTNYEIDTRVPMIISGPGVKTRGQQCNALVEFVDIYPTLCEMAHFPVPEHLQGTSLVPLLENPDQDWKTAAFSQFLLGRYGRTTTVKGEQMGYAIRTDRYRYVEWYVWNKEENEAGDLLCRELFDHQTDPQENKNIAEIPEYKNVVESLSQQLKRGWRYAKPGMSNE